MYANLCGKALWCSETDPGLYQLVHSTMAQNISVLVLRISEHSCSNFVSKRAKDAWLIGMKRLREADKLAELMLPKTEGHKIPRLIPIDVGKRCVIFAVFHLKTMQGELVTLYRNGRRWSKAAHFKTVWSC